MPQQTVNLGSAPDAGDGDTLRVGGDKINDNFTELYTDKLDKAGGTMTGDLVVPDEAYDATAWNGSFEVPTKNAVRDKIESLGASGLSVEDEGAAEGTGITTLNFTGTGVTATDVGGGQVDISIPGGISTFDLGDADDVDTTGQAAGESLVYDGAQWEPQRITYEGGPVTPAATADLATWVNQGTSSVADGIGAMVFQPQADGLVHGREMVAPATPFDLYVRLDMVTASDSATTTQLDTVGGIMLRDHNDGELLQFGIYHSRTTGAIKSNAVRLQRWTNATTFSATVFTYHMGEAPKWLRVNNDGTTLTLYIGFDGKNWFQIGTETIATFIDNVTRIGVSMASDSDNDLSALVCPYFSTTAPV